MKTSHLVTMALAAAAALGLARTARAQVTYAGNDTLSVGFALHRFQDDFGLGAQVGSPTFAGDRLRITLGGGVAWYPYASNAQGEQEWADHGHVRLVFEGGLRTPGSPIRLYGFGGPIAYVIPDRLSDTRIAVGGIGGFGFEFYFIPQSANRDGPVSYFVELGGVGTGARADKLAGKPTFGSGFVITTGFHWYL